MSETENKLRELVIATNDVELIETFAEFLKEVHKALAEAYEGATNEVSMLNEQLKEKGMTVVR